MGRLWIAAHGEAKVRLSGIAGEIEGQAGNGCDSGELSRDNGLLGGRERCELTGYVGLLQSGRVLRLAGGEAVAEIGVIPLRAAHQRLNVLRQDLGRGCGRTDADVQLVAAERRSLGVIEGTDGEKIGARID